MSSRHKFTLKDAKEAGRQFGRNAFDRDAPCGGFANKREAWHVWLMREGHHPDGNLLDQDACDSFMAGFDAEYQGEDLTSLCYQDWRNAIYPQLGEVQ